MAKEIKIGILAIVSVGLVYWGYKFILGRNILIKSNTYNVLYEDVQGLQRGTPVRVSGVQVGVVADIQLLPDRLDKVLVILDLDKGTKLPKDTRAVIVHTSAMGAKAINLMYDHPCTEDCLEQGAYLTGESKNLLASMASPQVVEDYMKVVSEKTTALMDSLNRMLIDGNEEGLGRIVNNIDATMAHLKSTTQQLDQLMRASSGDIRGTLSSTNELTTELANNKAKLTQIMDDLAHITGDLSKADMEKMMQNAQGAIANLKGTLEKAETSLAGFSTLVDDINSGKGTLGMLMKSDELYLNLNRMIQDIDSLAWDFKHKPYRYMPLKSRRKVQKYDRQDE